MSAELFNEAQTPFNLAGEKLDNGITAEGEARVRALAEAEARKAQRVLDYFVQANNSEQIRNRKLQHKLGELLQ